jgi:hypothetical protein
MGGSRVGRDIRALADATHEASRQPEWIQSSWRCPRLPLPALPFRLGCERGERFLDAKQEAAPTSETLKTAGLEAHHDRSFASLPGEVDPLG